MWENELLYIPNKYFGAALLSGFCLAQKKNNSILRNIPNWTCLFQEITHKVDEGNSLSTLTGQNNQ